MATVIDERMRVGHRLSDTGGGKRKLIVLGRCLEGTSKVRAMIPAVYRRFLIAEACFQFQSESVCDFFGGGGGGGLRGGRVRAKKFCFTQKKTTMPPRN
jgi:hypothetical protein